MNKLIIEKKKVVFEKLIIEWINEWNNELINEWKNEWLNEWMNDYIGAAPLMNESQILWILWMRYRPTNRPTGQPTDRWTQANIDVRGRT